jgi:Rad3-related DNA helicase
MFRSVEQSNFSARVAAHIASGDGPLLLEGATGLGKTRAYLAALAEAVRVGKRIAVVLPTHALIEQLLASSDLTAAIPSSFTRAAFKPRRSYETRGDYELAKESAAAADILICTSASVIIDQRARGHYNGVTLRDSIVFDEADQLPEAAALQKDCEVSGNEVRRLGLRAGNPRDLALGIIASTEAEIETRSSAAIILEAIDEPAWYQSAGMTDDGGIALYHKLPGRLLKRVANQSNVAFVSATLSIGGRFDDFRRAMGIESPSALSAIVEPSHHGTLRFFHGAHAVQTEEWVSAVQQCIANAKRPCLVVTPSNELSRMLGDMNPAAVVRGSDEVTAQAALRLSEERNVLIASAAWAGLDTPVQWKSIVVPRIPFQRPQVIDGNVESSFLDSRNRAIRRMRQVIGRGLRAPDAECEIYVLDDRLGMVESFIPARFRGAWKARGSIEGARVEFTLSRAERDPLNRKSALRLFGKKCMACDYVPRVDAQLEVHHLRPLAEGGERMTNVATDLAVLCANCHRLAHSAKPPLTVEALRALHTVPVE